MTLPVRSPTRRPLEGGTLLADFLGQSNILSRTGRLERGMQALSTGMLSSSAAAGAYVRRRGSLFLMGWGQANVPGSQSAVTLDRYGTSLHRPLILPFAASIVSLMVVMSAARTAGTLTVQVYIEGAASGLEAVIDGDNPLTVEETAAAGEYPFDAGEQVTLRITTSGWTPTSADVHAFVEVSAT